METPIGQSIRPFGSTIQAHSKSYQIKAAVYPAEISMLDTLTSLSLKLLALLIVFIAPIQSIIFAVGFLVIADLVSGICAAYKRQEVITSNGFRRTIVKSFCYLGCVLTAFVAQTNLAPEIPMVKVVTALIALTEIKSFFENIRTITGIDFWSALLTKLHGNKMLPPKKTRRKKKGK